MTRDPIPSTTARTADAPLSTALQRLIALIAQQVVAEGNGVAPSSEEPPNGRKTHQAD
jgi:hypothetical protein